MVIAGLAKRYTAATMPQAAALWQRFAEHLGRIPGQVGTVTYGVMTDRVEGTGGIGYLCGVEVAGSAPLPAGFSQIEVPALKYAVFAHDGHVSTIQRTVDAIWRQWLPASGYAPVDEPEFFERYDERFDPVTGTGGIEIWVPIEV